MHNLDTARIELGHEAENFEFISDEAVFNEAEQTELAAELLEVSSEAELENFLSDLISQAGKAVGGFVHSPTGQALRGLLKGAAKQILPQAGQVIGGYLGGSTGAQLGGQLASQAASMFEAEGEDREWKAANKIVNLTVEAVKNAANAPAGLRPQAAAVQAITEAAKLHAPELLNSGGSSAGAKSFASAANAAMSNARPGSIPRPGKHSGRWIRRNNHIVLLGV